MVTGEKMTFKNRVDICVLGSRHGKPRYNEYHVDVHRALLGPPYNDALYPRSSTR